MSSHLSWGSDVAKQYTYLYCLAMFIPPAVEHPARTWVFPAAPGAQFTVVYSLPVPITELAKQIGVPSTFLHRKARAGQLQSFLIGEQVCVSPAVAALVEAWYAENRELNRTRWWPREGFRDPDVDPAAEDS